MIEIGGDVGSGVRRRGGSAVSPTPFLFEAGRPGDVRHFVHKRIARAAKSFVTSGFSPSAAALGFLQQDTPIPRQQSRRTPIPRQFQKRTVLSARQRAPITAPRPVSRLTLAATTGAPTASPRPVTRLAAVTETFTPRPFTAPAPQAQRGCGPGFVEGPGGCVRSGGIPAAIASTLGFRLAFGSPKPRTTPMARHRGDFQAVEGAFGMPAMVPEEEMRRTLVCPRGMVLGDDELCYPKAVLPKRSKFRKWRGQARPPVSAADARHIRKAAAAKERVLRLAKDVGLHASKTKPSSSRSTKRHQHLLAAPPRQLQVISEETN